ncbi:orexin receptor type 2-like isoform X2 [Mya arenaria]|uniref:orexin receptor type 2-like isoform X2 n=1 Tax=Mya arenaria TaxID=6604 RepID=UPI0022E178A4|nr:orexin receptor type 2-like isoform X2 [Mya arenaria]
MSDDSGHITKMNISGNYVISDLGNRNCNHNDLCMVESEYFDYMYTTGIFPDTSQWILVAAYIVVFLVGLVGNVLVCCVIWKNRSMRTVTNIFIVNLAIADVAVIVMCLPLTLLVDITETWFLGTVICKINQFTMTTSIAVSVLTLTAISVERWYAICHPLRFHSTVRRARVIILVIWLLSSCVALPETIAAEEVRQWNESVLFASCYPVRLGLTGLMIWQICLIIGLYVLPICLMGFTYTHIAYVLYTCGIPGEPTTQRPMLGSSSSENEDQLDARKKAAKMLFAIVLLFALCFLPNHLLNILRYAGALDNVENAKTFALVAHLAIFLNSCLNPIIYNFMSDKFRKAFRQVLRACLHCRCKKARGTFRMSDGYKVTFTSTRTMTFNLTMRGRDTGTKQSSSSGV